MDRADETQEEEKSKVVSSWFIRVGILGGKVVGSSNSAKYRITDESNFQSFAYSFVYLRML